MAWVLANRLRIVVGNVIGIEQNYIVKGRLIKNNRFLVCEDLYLVCETLAGINDDTRGTLTNLDQSNASFFFVVILQLF